MNWYKSIKFAAKINLRSYYRIIDNKTKEVLADDVSGTDAFEVMSEIRAMSGRDVSLREIVNKAAARKYKDERNEGDKIDHNLLCCGYPENRRKDPYNANKGKNYPAIPENEEPKSMRLKKKKCDKYSKRASKDKVLIIAMGVSGSGKSTMAKELGKGGAVLGSDAYFMQNGEYKFDPTKLQEAHQWNQNRVKQAMEQGISPIVVDNTNTKNWERKFYVKMALEHGYEVQFKEPDWHPELKTPEGKWNFDFLKGRNVHGVPDAVLQNMINRYDYNPTIEDVLKSQAPWEK